MESLLLACITSHLNLQNDYKGLACNDSTNPHEYIVLNTSQFKKRSCCKLIISAVMDGIPACRSVSAGREPNDTTCVK